MDQYRGSSLIVVGRLALLLLAAGAAVSAFVLVRQGGAETSSRERYVCPMHPEVTSGGADRCPICGMALTPAAVNPAAGAASYSLPELENLPNYKLVASPRRRAFAQEVRVPAWVEAGGLVAAVLYEDEAADLAPGEQALFFRAMAPTEGIGVRLAADPPAPWDRSTSRVHFRLDPRAPAPGPGEVGWVRLAGRSRELLLVPVTAVVNSSQGPYVLVASAGGHTFAKRPVQIGRALGGFLVVMGGLDDQDQVVVGNTFFLDAERRLLSKGEADGVLQ